MADATVADVLAGSARWACVCSDALAWAAALPADSVHCCVTSPPYYGLRDYGADGQIGLEKTPGEYVERLVAVFRELRRAMHPSGVLWLNLGDSYNAAGRDGHGTRIGNKQQTNRASANGADNCRSTDDAKKPKDLLGIPWRVAFALQADGWYLRQWCPWVKRNPMPESVTDRPSSACECVFLLAKSDRYFFDMEAVKVPSVDPESYTGRKRRNPDKFAKHDPEGKARTSAGLTKLDGETYPDRNFRNGDLWFDSVGMLLSGQSDDELQLLGLDVTLKPYRGAHFAVMPSGLVEPCVLAGTSAKGVCPACGEPWRRVLRKERKPTRPGRDTKVTGAVELKFDRTCGNRNGLSNSTLHSVVGNRDPERHCTTTETVGWGPGCDCGAGEPVPAVVAEPFAGSGTVLKVSVDLGRRAVGCELNPDYMRLVARRMATVTPPLFTEV